MKVKGCRGPENFDNPEFQLANWNLLKIKSDHNP